MSETLPEIFDKETAAQPTPDKKKSGRGWLNLAGFCFAIADIALFAYGAFSQKPEQSGTAPSGPDHSRKFKWAGLSGLSAGFVGAVWGNPSDKRQLKQHEHSLGEYLREENFTIPEDIDSPALTKKSNAFDRINSFLHKHPAEMMTALQTMIGVQFMRVGLAGEGPWYKRPMIYSGSLLMGGALTGLLVKEKQPDPNNPPRGPLGKIKNYFQEKPLRGPSLMYNLNQLFFAKDTYDIWRQNPADKSILFRLVAIAGFLVGNTSLGLSFKSEKSGEGVSPEVLDTLEEKMAKVILNQPEERKQAALDGISQELASIPKLRVTAEEAKQSLQRKLSSFGQKLQKESGAWQDQVAQTHAAAGEIQI